MCFIQDLPNHPQHELMKSSMNEEFGFGGMLMINAGDMEKAYKLMEAIQNNNIGYLAVSLGFIKHYSVPQAQVHLLKSQKTNKRKWGFQKEWFVSPWD